MTSELADSYARCRRIARQSSTSFYYSFLLLPRAQRRAMCALYAFLRLTDDLGDSESLPGEAGTRMQRRAALDRWRAALEHSLCGQFDHPIFPAVADTLVRYAIPREHLHAVIDGVSMDLDEPRFETFADLEVYCYRVAGVVGLACLQIWTFHDARALEPARACGLAFQLTNILRDLGEDLERGRIYLPREDLERFRYGEEDLRQHVVDARFRQLLRFEIARAEGYYAQAAELAGYLEGGGRAMFGAMFETYAALLAEIKRRDGDVFGERIRLSSWRKLRIAAGWLLPRPAATSSLQTAAR
ncbi:MAG: phytoene/squalene synthase family protein [Planctomycetaceae bacterium]|nr:phytoene/squalene synthase family protein [Planctomycetaceae bacterium]